MQGYAVHRGITTVGRELSWRRLNSEYHKALSSQLMEQVNNVRMVVNPLWRGPGNIHGFVLDGKSYPQRQSTAQAPTVTTVSGVRVTILLLRTCNLTTIACGRWSLVTNYGEVAKRSS